MRMQLNIHLENQELLMRLLKESGKRPNPIIKKAVNDTAEKTRKKIYQKIRQDYTVKAGIFPQRSLQIKKATVSRLYAQLQISGAPISLPKAYKTAKNRKRSAAKAAVRRGGMKPLQKGKLKGFVSQMQTGHKGIFQRTPGTYMRKHKPRPYKNGNGKMTKGREAIKELVGPSTSKLTETVYRPMEDENQNELYETLWRFIDAAMGG